VLVQALGVLGEQSQQQEGGLIALGHPIANTRIYVLDGYMQLVPPGVRGELYIGGAGLAWGYSGQGGLTAQRFVPDPFSAEPGTRLYRTGDLVRWSEEGQLSFEGRGDGQVKLRGYRIEVGEIEAVLRQHPQIRDGVVMLRKDATDEPRLVSYVIGKQRVSIPREQLKEWLRQRLPEYMLPAEYMQIDELPLTANGKVDRDRLPRPLPEQYVVSKAHEAVQLRSPLEEMVAQVWRDLLGVPVIGAYDDFFALGGHSLLATRVIARLQATLQVTLPVQLLFEAPTVATFAQQVEQVLRQGEEVAIPPLVAGPRPEQLPLSFAQQRLWFLEQLEPGSPAYLVPAALKIEGQLVVSALERSMQELVKRHESLRTIFGEYAGQPVQVIKPAAWVQVPVIDLQSLPAEQRAALAQQIANQEGQRPCDLGQGPLLRIALLRLQAEEHVLLLTLHHIITDGWSSDLLVRELTTLYRAFVAGQPSPLQPLPLQYADYALWQRTWLQGAVLEKQLAYWRSQLTGAPYLALPTDYPRPSVQTSDGASQRRYLPVALTQGLWALSQQEHVTSFMTLLAAFQVLLARYTGQHDISVGTPIANRRQAESEGIIGFFVNTLVMRTDLSGDPSFVELLQRVRKISLEAYAHQDVPFESVVEAIEPARDLSRSPLFQVMFVLQKMPHSEEELTGVRLSPLRVEQISSKFDMSLFVTESEQGLACTLEYNTNLFEAETINRFLDHWQILLEGAVENPQARLFELPLLTVSEQEQLLSTWNATQRTYPHESSLQALFEQQVVRTPDAIAIADAEMQLSYTALNRRANQLARALRHQGIDQEERVGICLEHNCDLVIAILATLKAGATYVPLDPALPLQRRVFMLTDVQAKLLLTHTALADAALFELVPTIKLDQVWPNLMHEPAHNLAVPVASHQAAYVIYTSGSTGQPKGVVGSHRSLINRLYWSWQTYPFMSGERCCQKTSLGFVDAITELFAPLLQGTPVVLLDTQQRGDPLLLLEALAKWQVSRLVLVPSLLHTLLEDISDLQKHVPALQLWISSGEALTGTLARCFYDALPGRVLLNLYGSSEVAGDATAEEVRVLDEVIPIGRPLVNIQAYILDTNMRPVPVGVVGDLYIGGDGLARGYVNRPALTAERFVPHPFGPEPGARLYKTGDLARYRADGAIEYRGRVDQQVKIRGHRIELGEIEAVLGTHSALREVAVVARPDESGELRLVAYVVGQAAEAFGSRELRSYLQERLPAAMIPAAFVVLDALPLNSSGKVDRRALPELPVSQERADDNHAEARTPIEELIQGIWQVMLGRHEMGREENFFEQGGHSLLATRVIARVRNLLEIEIPLQALFEAPTIAGFAQRVEQVLQQGEGLSQFPLVAGERPEAIPLSFAQQRLWFLEQLEPGSTTYLLPAVLRVEGRIDVSALEHSIQKLVSRHESLRTVFTEHAGQPVQVIKPAAWVQVPVIDLQSLPAEQRAALAQQIANQEGQHPCDLGQGPLLRVALLRLRKEEHVLLLTLHHIITDGWSNQVLVRELTVLYQATLAGEAAPLAPLPVQYADYALWQRQWLQGEALERQLAYWREQLAGSQALDLPTDFPRPAMPRSQGASCRQVFSAELLSGLQACSRQEGVTLFMLLLASFQVLLARWSGQKDISVGTPIANRTHAEIEGVIGFFANTLVLRSDLSGNPAFRQVLQQVREVCLGAYAHQDVPFEQVVEALQPQRDLSRSPLFQVMLVLQEGGKEAAELDGVQIRSLPQESQSSKFDLTLSLQQVEQELYCHLEYRSDLFAPETMQRLLEQWQILLEGILHKPAACIWDLPLLSTQEQALQLVQWNATRTELPLEGTVAQLFEQQAQQRPDAIALVFEGTALTYGELNRRANILARYLQTLGVCPEIAVGVYLERCLEMVVGLLGILKAGGVYVPFDPDYPAERLAFMTQDAQVTVLVTKQELCTRLPVPLDNVLCLDRFLWEEQTGRVANLSVNVQPENLVYMIYTSGSTGKPKGAMNVQQGLVNRLLWMQQTYPLIPGDRVLQKTPFSFDVSVWEFFWPLITGASLVMAQPHGHQDPAYLKKLIQQEQVSIVHFIPSMLQAFLLEPTNIQACAALRQVFCSGEALSASLQARFFELSATTLGLHNLYGPTEASIEVTFWDCLRDYPVQSVPIGRPIANLQIYVLDARLQLLPTGAIGELYIGGVGLARGYWQRPDLTAERFVPHPWSQNPGERLYRTGDLVRYRKDGALEFVGRKDGQVKLRGYRIELGEIEACLGLHPGVRECIVTAREDHQGEKRLVAYLVAQQSTPSSSELRRFVMETLPEYMAPAAFVFLDELPHTPNGKVDLRALPQPRLQPAEEQERALGLRTPIEELVATIWSEVLGVEQIGQESDFFRAGGHSLVAFRMISRLRTLLGIEIELRTIFAYPTLVEFAGQVEQARRLHEGLVLPALRAGVRPEEVPLSFAQQRLWLLDQLEPGRSTYLVSSAYRMNGTLDPWSLERSLEALIQRHESLRTTFRSGKAGLPIQVIHTVAGFVLPVIDLQALGRQRRVEESQLLARQVAQQPLDLVKGPLMCVYLLRQEQQEHVILLTLHHIITDGWSNEVLARELMLLYQAYCTGQSSPLPSLPIQYADYALWQRQWLQGEVLQRQIAYWKKQLWRAQPLKLPTDVSRDSVQSNHGSIYSYTFSTALWKELVSFSQRESVTMFMLLLTVFQALLYRLSGQTDIVVGTDTANRTHVETEGLIGFFVNLLALRTNIQGTSSFHKLLQQVRATVLEAYTYQELPFDMVVEHVQVERKEHQTPLIQALFVMQNTPQVKEELPGIAFDIIKDKDTTARFDLAWFVHESVQGGDISIVYRTALFKEQTIATLLRRFEAMIQSVVTSPDASIDELEIITPEEKAEQASYEARLYSAGSRNWQKRRTNAIDLSALSLEAQEHAED
jgi:amino acid adenylation domain-containing protein